MNRVENVRITAADILANSASGNPRWRLHVDGLGTFLTEPDGQIGYAIENFTKSTIADTFCIGDGVPPVTLLLNDASRVIGIEKDGTVL